MDILTLTLSGLTSSITCILGYWGGWFFTRKKYNSEVDSNLIRNMQESLKFYQAIVDDNKSRLEEALRRNEQLEKELSELRKQMFSLMQTVCVNLTCTIRQRNNVNNK